MADIKVDGLSKPGKEEIERKRRLVLESIGETRRDEPAAPAETAKKVDALAVLAKPARTARPPAVPDLLKAAQKEDPEIGKELSEEKRKRWQAEIGGFFAAREKASAPAVEKPPAPAPAPKPVQENAPKPSPAPVSRVNPFKNEVVDKRIEERKRLAEEAERAAALARKQEQENQKKTEEAERQAKARSEAQEAKRRERERQAKAELKARRSETARARRERLLAAWDRAGRLMRDLPGRLWTALGKALLVFAFGFVLTLLFYAVFAVVVVKFDVDNPYSRRLSSYLPVPAYIGRDGAIDYYRYKDVRTGLSATGLGGEDLAESAKAAVVEDVIVDGLAMRYGLASASMPAEEFRARLAGAVLGDQAINQVGLARIAKIREMIAETGDFVKVSNKYGDSQGQVTITAANRDQYEFYPALAALQVGENSGIVNSPQGYHIFRCFDRKGDDLYLSYVFVRAVTLDDYLAQQTRDYWLWSLVD